MENTQERVWIRVLNPSLRYWNYVKLDLGLEVRETFNEKKLLVQLDANVTDTVAQGLATADEIIGSFKDNPHFTKNGAAFTVVRESA